MRSMFSQTCARDSHCIRTPSRTKPRSSGFTLLAEWRESHESACVETLPPLPEPVESAMRQVWGVAWNNAQKQLQAKREALS